MKFFYLLSVFLHVISVVIWLGGMFFLVLVIRPVIRKKEITPLSGRLCHLNGKEENMLFPEIEKAGIPREGGPIGVHEKFHNLVHDMEKIYV